jgi:hypothetical protein
MLDGAGPKPAPFLRRENLMPAGKLIIILGIVLVAVGLIVTLVTRSGIPLGRLPGDVVYRGKNTTVYFPIVTSIVLSILLSLVFWLLSRFQR